MTKTVWMIIIGVLFALIILIFTQFNSNNNKNQNGREPNKKIGILQISQHPALDTARSGIIKELEKHSNVSFVYECANGDAVMATQIAQKFLQQKSSVIVTLGTVASQAVAFKIKNNPGISLVFSSVTDPISAGLVRDPNKPDSNITGVTDFVAPLHTIKFIKKVTPNTARIGVIYNPGEPNSVALIEELENVAKSEGVLLIKGIANSTGDVMSATQSIVNKVDVLLVDNDNTALSALQSIIKVGDQNNIPVFCSDIDAMGTGILAAVGPDQFEIGEKAGAMVIDILQGTEVKKLPVFVPGLDNLQMRVSKSVAARLGIDLSKLQSDKEVILES